jgi:hypothetical protein
MTGLPLAACDKIRVASALTKFEPLRSCVRGAVSHRKQTRLHFVSDTADALDLSRVDRIFQSVLSETEPISCFAKPWAILISFCGRAGALGYFARREMSCVRMRRNAHNCCPGIASLIQASTLHRMMRFLCRGSRGFRRPDCHNVRALFPPERMSAPGAKRRCATQALSAYESPNSTLLHKGRCVSVKCDVATLRKSQPLARLLSR